MTRQTAEGRPMEIETETPIAIRPNMPTTKMMATSPASFMSDALFLQGGDIDVFLVDDLHF